MQHRPLPDLPSSADDAGGGIRDSSAAAAGSQATSFSLEGSLRWTSRENLLAAATDEDPQLFVALYDFQAGGENQLSLKKTEQVTCLHYLALLASVLLSNLTHYFIFNFKEHNGLTF